MLKHNFISECWFTERKLLYCMAPLIMFRNHIDSSHFMIIKCKGIVNTVQDSYGISLVKPLFSFFLCNCFIISQRFLFLPHSAESLFPHFREKQSPSERLQQALTTTIIHFSASESIYSDFLTLTMQKLSTLLLRPTPLQVLYISSSLPHRWILLRSTSFLFPMLYLQWMFPSSVQRGLYTLFFSQNNSCFPRPSSSEFFLTILHWVQRCLIFSFLKRICK